MYLVGGGWERGKVGVSRGSSLHQTSDNQFLFCTDQRRSFNQQLTSQWQGSALPPSHSPSNRFLQRFHTVDSWLEKLRQNKFNDWSSFYKQNTAAENTKDQHHLQIRRKPREPRMSSPLKPPLHWEGSLTHCEGKGPSGSVSTIFTILHEDLVEKSARRPQNSCSWPRQT